MDNSNLILNLKRQNSEDWVSVDISPAGIELSFSAKEVQEITQRRAAFSKQFTLPFTDANTEFLQYQYNVNISTGYFNPNIKTSAVISAGNVTQIEGFAQLIEVNVTKKVYTLVVFSQVADLYADIKGKKLRELDLSYYNHKFMANLEDMWGSNQLENLTSDVINEVIYPIIDWGKGYNAVKVRSNYGINSRDMRPAIKMKSVFDQILKEAGYTYTSTLLNNNTFKNLFLQLGTDKEVSSDNSEVLKVGMDFNNILDGNTEQLTFSNETGPTYYDTEGANQASGTRFVCPTKGKYSFNFSCTATYNQDTGDSVGSYRIYIEVNNIEVGEIVDSFTSTSQVIDEAFSVDLVRGDIVKIYAEVDDNILPGSSNFDFSAGALELIDCDKLLVGGIVSPEHYLPDTTQGEFVKAIVERFNLIIDSSQADPKDLIIETYSDYYNNGEVKDWTYKIDNSSDIIVKSMHDFHKKRVIYKDAEDSDRYSEYYQNTYGNPFGTLDFLPNSQFADGEQKTTEYFAPFLIERVDDYFDFLIAKLHKVNSNGQPEPSAVKPRFFYYDGTQKSVDHFSNNEVFFKVNAATLSNYPLVSAYKRFVSAANPDQDYNWGYQYPLADSFHEFYFGTPSVKTIFNTYHRAEFNEFYSDEARMLICKVILTPFDIATLKLSHKIFIKDTYYKINSIKGYKVGQDSPCTVELIKVFTASEFESIDSNPSDHLPDDSVEFRNAGGTTTTIDRATAELYGYYWKDNKAYWRTPRELEKVDNEKVGKYDKFQELRGNDNTPTGRNIKVFGSSASGAANNAIVLGDNVKANESNALYIGGTLGQTKIVNYEASTSGIGSFPLLGSEGLGIITRSNSSGTVTANIVAMADDGDTWLGTFGFGYRSLSPPEMIGDCFKALNICYSASMANLTIEEGTHGANDFQINVVSDLAKDINWKATFVISEIDKA